MQRQARRVRESFSLVNSDRGCGLLRGLGSLNSRIAGRENLLLGLLQCGDWLQIQQQMHEVVKPVIKTCGLTFGRHCHDQGGEDVPEDRTHGEAMLVDQLQEVAHSLTPRLGSPQHSAKVSLKLECSVRIFTGTNPEE